jgi:cytochrome c oxidase cbb3-type subunit I/II
MLYWLIPKMWGTKLFSTKMANTHFWLGTLGIIVYALPMYTAGVVQSLMWKNFNAEGFLEYPNFLETVTQIIPMYMMRAIGGLLYFSGVIIMVVNLMKTAKQGKFMAEEAAEAPALEKKKVVGGHWHSTLERKPVIFTVLTLVAILIGGVIEMVPTFLIKSNIPTIASVQPYTPLELHGRDIYIREGCNNCHSQMVRPFRSETVRYKGEYSKAGEFVYDHPFLWGSKRTGPDLHRVGGLYNNVWHFNHMLDPTSTSPGSIMPPYPWLYRQQIDPGLTAGKIKALRTVGVPYEEGYEEVANNDLKEQAMAIKNDLKENNIDIPETAEIVALIAYLQRLGTDIKAEPTANK